jgi:hypothetical protein
VALAQTLLATGMLIGDELLTRQSIDVHRFGGFYEIALPSDGGVRKVGDITYAFWEANFHGNRKLANGSFDLLLLVKVEYVQDILVLRSWRIKYDKTRFAGLDDDVQAIGPLYREISIRELDNKWRLNMNGSHYCHCVFLKTEGRSSFVIVPEIFPNLQKLRCRGGKRCLLVLTD